MEWFFSFLTDEYSRATGESDELTSKNEETVDDVGLIGDDQVVDAATQHDSDRSGPSPPLSDLVDRHVIRKVVP